MQQFIIKGGTPLNGEVVPGGNKNAVLKMIPACLLTDETVILHNVPQIIDVQVTIDLMQDMGCIVEWVDGKTLKIEAQNITKPILDPLLAGRTRASFVFAGPMLGRVGQVELPAPGGDIIGERRMDTHVQALKQLGVEVSFNRGIFTMEAKRLIGANILLQEASVTATENVIMAAVLASGTTVIRNAASEPHVQDLCNMLIALGAKIDGVGSNQIIIEGVEKLHGGQARVGADYMEVGSYIGAAAITGGRITIKDADPHYMEMSALIFARLGVVWDVQDNDIIVSQHQSLSVQQDIGNRIPIIKAQPWPAFPPDLMSIALVVATQSAGAVIFHDWMYESRFFFTDKLVRMGARITLCDPHRVLVQGPSTLKASNNITSPDIRAGMALILAALAAKGETHISNIHQVDRGYEHVEKKLTALGANICRVDVETSKIPEADGFHIEVN